MRTAHGEVTDDNLKNFILFFSSTLFQSISNRLPVRCSCIKVSQFDISITSKEILFIKTLKVKITNVKQRNSITEPLPRNQYIYNI